MFPTIYGILAKLGAVSPVDNWWEAGGASGAVAVYQPIGAADLANSYTDLSGNGNDASVGVAPTWDSVGGWTFDGVTQYLDSGVVPNQEWTAAIKFSNAALSTFPIFGQNGGNNNRFFIIPNYSSNTFVIYGLGTSITSPGRVETGVLAIADTRGYRNGVLDTGAGTLWGGATSYTVFFGGANGSSVVLASVKIQAVAIYDNTLSAAQVLAVSDAMAAL